MREQLTVMRQQLTVMANEIERLLVFDEAVSMAHQERTGEELQPGEPYTAKDAWRAEEIMQLFRWSS